LNKSEEVPLEYSLERFIVQILQETLTLNGSIGDQDVEPASLLQITMRATRGHAPRPGRLRRLRDVPAKPCPLLVQ
jgi:hypothetical protein